MQTTVTTASPAALQTYASDVIVAESIIRMGQDRSGRRLRSLGGSAQLVKTAAFARGIELDQAMTERAALHLCAWLRRHQ